MTETTKVISPYAYAGMRSLRTKEFDKIIQRASPDVKCDVATKAACKAYDIDPDEIRQKGRKRRIVKVRQIIMWYLCRSGLTLKDIAKYFNQDHTTVIHSRDTVNDLMIDPEYKAEVHQLINLISK